MIGAALPAQDALTPGMIAVVQTFGDDLTWHPRVDALVTRGGWDARGEWVAVPFVDGEAAALVLRHRCCGVTIAALATAPQSLHPPPAAPDEGTPARVSPPTQPSARSRCCVARGCCPGSAFACCCRGGTRGSPCTPR